VKWFEGRNSRDIVIVILTLTVCAAVMLAMVTRTLAVLFGYTAMDPEFSNRMEDVIAYLLGVVSGAIGNAALRSIRSSASKDDNQ
jgi:hypothetical protein